ncbi:uncharacterized protein [Typha angustifolia]|uniref:uncharacterized protein n=1 Tax=Typha angustifolia TaxID=59011 RepID=UPI003C2F1981
MAPPASTSAALFISPESLSSAGLTADRLNLPSLQSKMKCDPEGYEAELDVLYRQFESSLEIYHHNDHSSSSTDNAAKDLSDLAMFLAHVAPFYPEKLAVFPGKIVEFLRTSAASIPSSLRVHLTQALILLVNRKIVDLGDTLELFMDLQVIGDRTLRKLAFSHVVHSIRRMNQKHKNELENRKLQNILFSMLQAEEELRAKRSLIVLCDLHRRRVWFDDRTANAICTGCFHSSSRIMIAAISFLLGYEQIQEEDDSEASSSEDEASQQPEVVISKEAVYKAHHKGTSASKKKKKAKLQRAIRSMKRQKRIASENTSSNYYSPLTYLKDPQGFAEKLFSRLQKCNERFEIRMMMLKVIARTVGMHRLILLNLYPYLSRYVQPHQRDVTTLLAAAVQACHDMVPPDAVEPLFKQIVNQFVHDRSRTEAIAVGLNVVREICLRMPLLMNEDLLRDLVLYKKSHEKAVSIAARSLISLFREICPSLLVKKDRGRPVNPKARPKAFGEITVASDVLGVELLQQEDDYSAPTSSDDELIASGCEDEGSLPSTCGDDSKSEISHGTKEEGGAGEIGEEDDVPDEDEDEDEGVDQMSEDDNDAFTDEDCEELGDNVDGDRKYDESDDEDAGDDNEEMAVESSSDYDDNDNCTDNDSSNDEETNKERSKAVKRKFVDYVGQLNAAEASLRALKRIAGARKAQISSDETDGILSNEDFRRIKELKAKKEVELAMTQQGLLKKGLDSKTTAFKIPSSEQLSTKRVDPAKLESNIRRKLSKEERLALVRAGREDRGKYQSRAAVKQKKTGGLSNRQKEHKKAMPLAAKRATIARSRQEKKKQQRRSGKQFRGKKAWK